MISDLSFKHHFNRQSENTTIKKQPATNKELKAIIDRQSAIIEEQGALIEKQNVIIKELRSSVANMQEKIEEQAGTIKLLREEIARLKKNSSNSSKPPSSDIVKPPKKKAGGRKRKRGGQKGQSKRRCSLTLEQAHEIVHHHLDGKPCPRCGKQIKATDGKAAEPIFQYELPEQPVTLTAHVAEVGECEGCGQISSASIPSSIRKGGLLGPRLTAYLALLRALANASVSNCQKVLAAMGVKISTGAICNRLNTMSRALRDTHENMQARLPQQPSLNIDETTLPQEGKKLWIWSFVAPDFTLFKINPSRSSAVLESVLGRDCRAIIGSDLFSAYTKFAKTAPVTVQLCWAHLIRDLKHIAESTNKAIANYGERLLKITKKIFRAWHRRSPASAKRTDAKMKKLKTEFLQTGKRTQAGGAARTMRNRLRKHGPKYFTFLEQPDIEPTNNLAEQQIRQCVISRRVTQGVRGEKGQQFWERIWTVLATLRRRNQNAFAFLCSATSAYVNNQPAPNL